MTTKVKKKTFLGDTFEQLSDTGTSTVKQTGQAVKQTFDPLDSINQEDNQPIDQKVLEKAKAENVKNKNHTSLDFDDLEKKYKEQDKQKEEALKQHLFKLVKEGEKEAYEAKKKKEEERKKKEEEEKELKKKRAKEEKKKQEESSLPKGKQRRNIFSPRKKAQEQHTEYKPSSGQG